MKIRSSTACCPVPRHESCDRLMCVTDSPSSLVSNRNSPTQDAVLRSYVKGRLSPLTPAEPVVEDSPVASRPIEAKPEPLLIAEPMKVGGLSPSEAAIWGAICGLAAAIIYTGTNSCLRAVKDVDPFWVQAIKAVPTATAMFPWMLYQRQRGINIWPGWPATIAIICGAMSGQVVGNISFQWSLGEVGIALAVPLTLGGMIISAAILGRVFLHEKVSYRVAGCLALLLIANFVLFLGAGDARKSVAGEPATLLRLALGVSAAFVSGLGYSVLNVLLRYRVSRGASLPATLFTVAVTGICCLGFGAYQRIGFEGMIATSSADWQMMILAGVSNTIAFVLLTKSLQLISVVYVNAINATQATMAAVAGVLIFGEAASPFLFLGVVLTIVGLVLMRPQRHVPTIAATAASAATATASLPVGTETSMQASKTPAMLVSDVSETASAMTSTSAASPIAEEGLSA